jgi:hypothetical protein
MSKKQRGTGGAGFPSPPARDTRAVGHGRRGGPPVDQGQMDYRNLSGLNPRQIQGGLYQTGDALRYRAPPPPDLGATPTNMRRSAAPKDLNRAPIGHSKGTSPGGGTKPY